ncbi:MAG: PepSY domain-containing protein [Novosphingobium sp.]
MRIVRNRKRYSSMRKFHRWVSVFFGVFLLWIAVTGTISQILPLLSGDDDRPKAAQSKAKPSFTCPPDYSCRPKPKPGDPRALVGLFHHLHSGETFGPLGVAIGLLSGFAMIFFSFSGLWMYIQMWRNRGARGLTPRWFWK